MGADVKPRDLAMAAELATWDGRARARRTGDGMGLEVSAVAADGRARLVLRIEPARGTLTLAVPEGDLRLCAPHGRVSVEGKSIALDAREELAQRTRRWRLESDAIEAKAEAATWTVGQWRLRAGWIRERAGHIRRHVEHTLEARAERVRTVASGLFQVVSGRTAMRSKDHTAIDGKRVLLG